MKPTRTRIAPLAAVVAASLLPVLSAAEGKPRGPLPPLYVEECGSCHVAYPARFLGAASWRAVLDGLADHFGEDATLAPEALAAVGAWLEAGARRRETSAGGTPLLRIRETRWFRDEHPRPSAAIWRHPEVRSPANCGACHTNAESGDYRERGLRVPKSTHQGATK